MMPGANRFHETSKIGFRGKKNKSAGNSLFRLRLPASIRSEACTGLDACNGHERAPAGLRLSTWELRARRVSPIPARDRTGAEAIIFERDSECAEAGRTLKAVDKERQ